jgi:cytochrome c-type biogenesis protein CcmH
MTLFLLSASSLLLISIIVIIKALLNKNNEKINSNQNSMDIYNQKLNEINFDIENHLITKNEANNAIEELEYSLIKDNKNTDTLDSKLYFSNLKSKKTISVILVLVIPVFVISVYSFIGDPNSIEKLVLVSDLKNSKNNSEKLVSVEQMLNRVERRLLDEPNNSDDWLMLANSYVVLKRYPEAIRAFENLYRLKGDDPSLLFRYADVLAMANSGIFAGKPSELIKKALRLDPQNTMGLWLAGLVAYEEGEINEAINYWQNVLPKLEIGSEEEKNIRKYIQFAKENNNISIQNDNSITQEEIEYSLKLNIELSPNFTSVNKSKVVFIYAKPINSPNNMPIIVLRKTVADLPLLVEMNDSMSMLPSNKLSDYKSVQVLARISKSGNAKSEIGDLIGVVDSVSTTSRNITKLIINTTQK